MRNRQNDLLELSKLLDLKIDKEKLFDHGASYIVNDFQQLFIRLEGYKSKGVAILSPRYDIEGVKHQDVYYGIETRIEINFNPNKDLEKIASDIKRRILNTDEAQKALSDTIERVEDHRGFNAKTLKRKELIESLDFDMGNSYAYLSTSDHGRIKVFYHQNTIEIMSIKDDLYERILKLIASEVAKDEK